MLNHFNVGIFFLVIRGDGTQHPLYGCVDFSRHGVCGSKQAGNCTCCGLCCGVDNLLELQLFLLVLFMVVRKH
jgi:hypothetical protein